MDRAPESGPAAGPVTNETKSVGPTQLESLRNLALLLLLIPFPGGDPKPREPVASPEPAPSIPEPQTTGGPGNGPESSTQSESAPDLDPALEDALRRDYQKHLPRLQPLFAEAGRRHGLDWRLLAAVGYQESKWNHRAVSAEGVRGLMMLTGPTARELNIRDRFDPAQSITGGAAYLSRTLTALPAQIPDPDRVWYALAAYNLGPGHVEDARVLIQARGGDPDRWDELKRVLPLLAHRAWHRHTRHGRARGGVAVRYVNSVRRYYELLVWLTHEEESRKPLLARADGT